MTSRRSVLSFLSDNNPFYLLSAACMLTGIFVLNDSLDWSPLPKHNLLMLIITLNIYEMMLVGVAVLLLRRGIVRDAMWVLLIEALFMADGGFLNMEIFTASVRMGFVVNIVVAALAAVKLALIFRAARLPIGSGLFAFVLAQLLILFAVPGIFARIAVPHDGWLPDVILYSGWWTLALLPVMFVMLAGGFDLFMRGTDEEQHTARLIARMFVLLPIVSLLAHLSMVHWVYKVSFHPADLAPLLLGMSLAIGRTDHRFASWTRRMEMQLLIPLVAIVLASFSYRAAEMKFGALELAPLRLTLLAAMVVYLDAASIHRHWIFLFASAMCLGGACMGSSAASVSRNSIELGDTWMARMKRFIPRTAMHWGFVSVGMSFVLLVFGAMLSLRKGVKRIDGE